jgi:Ni/Co efflux regulator RcnB
MKSILIVTTAILALASAASAGPNGNGGGNGHGNGAGHGNGNGNGNRGDGGWTINNGVAVNPAGRTMRKAPPGQVKKMSRRQGLGVGNVLPSNYPGYRVVEGDRYRLAAPPAGYEYVRVGNDVYLRQANTGVISSVIQNLFR